MANDNVSALLAMAGSGGGGSVTPASIVSATGQMTSQQAADTLDNLGGEPEKLVVTVTETGGVYSADKTFEEIEAAVTAGKRVEVIYGDYTYYLYTDDGGAGYYFISIGVSTQYHTASILMLFVDYSDVWTYAEEMFHEYETTVRDMSSTSITLDSSGANVIYEFGTLTSLTITVVEAVGDFIIRFTSGATATTTNFPASMVFPEAFSAEANMRYEINVSNGYALAVGWPTT